MFISIIIPSYGREHLLNKCIERLRESACGDYEIIVVDDYFMPPFTIKDPNVKMVFSNNRIGPAGARNLGASKARGDILLFIDSDVILSNNAYRQILEAFEASDFDAVYGIYSLDFPYTDFCSNYKNLYWNFNQMHSEPKSYNVCTAIFSIKKDVFDEIGGFNSESLVGEDREIGIKLKEKNKKIFLNKRILGIHYKKLNFLQLLEYPLKNSVALTLLSLSLKIKRWHSPKSPQRKSALIEKKQMASILVSPTIVFLGLIAFSTSNPIFLLFFVFALGIFLCLIANFLKYSYKHFGLRFSFSVFCVYLLENFVVFIGICLGIFRFFVFKRRALNFKIGG